jgi:hypothetical protein
MNKALKIFIIILALPIIVLGLKTMIDPASMIAKWGMDPIGNTGLNSLRSMFPGILLGGGIMMIFGVWRKDTTWFLATAFLMLVVAFGRVLSFVLDGFDSASVPPTVYELVVAAVMIFAHKRLKGS